MESNPTPARRALRRSPRAIRRAFTLLELIIVITIIGILTAIAVPNYLQAPVRAKEAVLKTNLRTLREVIDQHHADKGGYPATLEELVEKGYLRKVPEDPFTGNTEWTLEYEEVDEEDVPPETEEGEGGAGVVDVHSSSTSTALDGTPYSEW